MPDDLQPPDGPTDITANSNGDRFDPLSIEDELRDSYLTYAMSAIISRALPDVRDGLQPSQRRIVVAMHDLGLVTTSATSKCAGIVGETMMERYHPHGEQTIYPTLVRMAQDWAMRHRLIHPQGNFGSIAGLPPAAMRYTEARLSPVAGEILQDLDRDTVDFIDNYDGKYREPLVLPSRFPNLLVNGSDGIAVGMATEIPPHNLREVCDGLIKIIEQPDVSIDELIRTFRDPIFHGVLFAAGGIYDGFEPAAVKSWRLGGNLEEGSRTRLSSRRFRSRTRNASRNRRAGQGRAHQGHQRLARRKQRPWRRTGPPGARPQARRRSATRA